MLQTKYLLNLLEQVKYKKIKMYKQIILIITQKIKHYKS